MLEPWTRDGRVRADVVTVAADVSGLISDVFVHDNEKVSKGQQLFRIDQRRFQYALDQAKADVASQQATLDQAKRDLVRSKSLTDVAITRQQVEQAQQAADEAQAKLDAANAALEVARLNLERSTVVAPVNGIVTNFDLLPGRYVNAGAAVFALIDSDTFQGGGLFRGNQTSPHPYRRRRDRETDRRLARAFGPCREHRLRHRGSEPQHEQRAVGVRQSDLQLGPLGTTHPGADQARRCAAGPSSGGRPHGHRVDWKDQMVVRGLAQLSVVLAHSAIGHVTDVTQRPADFHC